MGAMLKKQAHIAAPKIGFITEKTIDGKKYIVKSVSYGGQDLRTTLLKLAERKAIREMGLDGAIM